MLRRRRRSGHIFLPFFGFVPFLPWFFLFCSLLMHWAKIHSNGGAKAVTLSGILKGTCCVGLPMYVVTLVATIVLAIVAGELEAAAQRVGLGANQYWTGKNWQERLSREIVRFLLLFSSVGLGYYTASGFLPAPADIQLWGTAAFTQGYLILLFLVVIGPLKVTWPDLLFSGDPSAYYHHHF